MQIAQVRSWAVGVAVTLPELGEVEVKIAELEWSNLSTAFKVKPFDPKVLREG